MDWVIQKAVEIGVTAVRPLVAARAAAEVVRTARAVRWGRIALEAARQCGRSVVPAIEPCAVLPPCEGDCLGLLLDPDPAAASIGTLCARARPTAVWIAVGRKAA